MGHIGRMRRMVKRNERENAAFRQAVEWLLIGLLIGLFLMIFIKGARAEEKHERLVILAAISGADYIQSSELFFGAWRGQHEETNALLGKYPTRLNMLTFGAAGIGLVWLLSEILPEPWDMILLDSAITSESMIAEDNQRHLNDLKTTFNTIPIVITWRF